MTSTARNRTASNTNPAALIVPVGHSNSYLIQALLIATCLAFVCSTVMAGNVYRWKDADGSVHYGEHPPQGADATQLSTSTGKRSNRDFKSPAAATPSADNQAEEQASPPMAATEAPKPKKDKGICKRARYNLKMLTERARIRQQDENGEESYMSEAQKSEQKQAAKDAIKDYC